MPALHDKTWPCLHKHIPYNDDLLKAPLTRHNYRKKFHQLLCREEEEHNNMLMKRYNINTAFLHVNYILL